MNFFIMSLKKCLWFVLYQILIKEVLCCGNFCSGHGQCGYSDNQVGVCTCQTQYNTSEAPDCSLQRCPSGTAWVDYASAVDTAHAQAECSNMGLCDRTSGKCNCEEGFEGLACERLACPNDCSKNGICITMRQAAQMKDDYRLFSTNSYNLWDADKITGCLCDRGYTGYDCSERKCEEGANPLISGTATEKQIIECTCQTTCSGYFYISFKSEHIRVEHDDTAALLQTKLENLHSIRAVGITMYGGSTVCDNDGVSTEIEFTKDAGNQPAIIVEQTTGLSSTGTTPTVTVVTGGSAGANGGTSRDATSVSLECSGRGTCDVNTGICACVSVTAASGGAFSSSDGLGGTGNIHNCGYVATSPTGCFQGRDADGATQACSGHGTCDTSTYTCTCSSGYTGNDCSLMTCPTGPAIFDEATATDTAHASVECSNRGECKRTSGECECYDGWEGSNCGKMSCPGTGCNGHGTCFTISQLAQLSEDNGVLRGVTYGATPSPTVWDADIIRGCYCDNAYFGRFSGGYGDYIGYDCSLLACPVGDNPQTLSQVNEVQIIKCIATSGSFTVSFRQMTSLPIDYAATTSEVKLALENMFNIEAIASVSFSGGSTTQACSSGGTATSIQINFNIPGDLPSMTVDTTLLAGATVSVIESVRGTTEAEECSGQGICDRTTGLCSCFSGFFSSDGSGDGETPGERGDCGALTKFAYFEETS